MARKRDVVVVATNAERGRAARLRMKQRRGVRLARADYDWLRAYDAERRRNKLLRKRRSKRPRKATKAELAKARRLKKRERRRKNNPITKAERDWLKKHRKERKKYKRYKARASNKDDARAILNALATWLRGGKSKGVYIEDAPDSYGGYEARFAPTPVLGDDAAPIPNMPESHGKYASVAVEYELAPEEVPEDEEDDRGVGYEGVRRRQWAIAVAATDKWDQLAADFQIEAMQILDDYYGNAITAISCIVRDPKE